MHCIAVDGESSLVLATRTSVPCFEGPHVFVYALAVVTIAVEVVIFPIFILAALGKSVGWCDRGGGDAPSSAAGAADAGGGADADGAIAIANGGEGGDGGAEEAEGGAWEAHFSVEHNAPYYRHSGTGATQWESPPAPTLRALPLLRAASSGGTLLLSDATREVARSGAAAAGRGGANASARALGSVEVDKGRYAGTVHGGACCRCACYVARLKRNRAAFDAAHDKATQRQRRLAYSSFTFSDYKPEFFYIRVVFLYAMSTIAFCNAFFDPTTLSTWGTGVVSSDALLIAVQAARFAISAVALVVPPIVILSLLPNKDGSRWKMPLRAFSALVSLGMLALNAFSSGVERGGDAPALLEASNALSYTVLALSFVLILTMAVCFVIFVVFRGAQLQKAEEDLAEEAEERQAEERAAPKVQPEREGEEERRKGRPLGAQQAAPSTAASAEAREGRSAEASVVVYRESTEAEAPVLLPQGWIKLASDAAVKDSRPYWHHAASLTSLWLPPAADEVAAADTKARALQRALQQRVAPAPATPVAVPSGSGSSESSDEGGTVVGSSVGVDRTDATAQPATATATATATTESARGRKKNRRKFVRWTFVKRDDFSLARGLLGAAAAVDAPPPTYLRRLIAHLFAVAGASAVRLSFVPEHTRDRIEVR